MRSCPAYARSICEIGNAGMQYHRKRWVAGKVEYYSCYGFGCMHIIQERII